MHFQDPFIGAFLAGRGWTAAGNSEGRVFLFDQEKLLSALLVSYRIF